MTQVDLPPAKRRRPRSRVDYYKWSAGVGVPLLVALIGVWVKVAGGGGEIKTPNQSTIITSYSIIENQYQQVTGHALTDEQLKQEIQTAINLAKAQQWEESRRLFESIAARAPVPAVYTNLGALESQRGNVAAARAAYQKAVGQNPDYQPARENLARLNTPETTATAAVAAGAREVEPNNDVFQANIVTLPAKIAGEIATETDDDVFQFRTPGQLRDLLEINVENGSTTLTPWLVVQDSRKEKILDKYAGTAGANFEQTIPVDPGAAYYVSVKHYGVGRYTLSLTMLKRYDRYEPNDDLAHATPIAAGAPIEASIMDPKDLDCYVVKTGSGVSGEWTAEVTNRSQTFAPQVTVYDGTRNQMKYGYATTIGADTKLSFPVQPNATYYLRVERAYGDNGAYTLTVKP